MGNMKLKPSFENAVDNMDLTEYDIQIFKYGKHVMLESMLNGFF